jgi:PelA/Pel-15E family pectate lyase
LWRYSTDLARREGEGRASETTVWVQPPGTPSVADALLTAYERTHEEYLLDAARAGANALIQGQLQSGGWTYRIEFSPEARRRYAYRLDGGDSKARDISVLDDNTTQAALHFLMRLDQVLEFKDAAVHEAARYALERLLAAQYPNGAWPQRFTEPPDAEKFPVRQASYPDTWSWTHPGKDYRSYYTFNDNTIADTIATMLAAADIYGEDRFHDSARKGGRFILLAQMPEPQPAWAQQYNAEMHPAWARRFEPPSLTGGESQGVLRTLLNLYEKTGDREFLKPIPRAMEYLADSRLPNGQLARFYEL